VNRELTTGKLVGWGLALAVLLGLALLLLPPQLVPDGALGDSDQARLMAEGGFRSTILQLIGGLVVVLGLIYTASQVGISRETHYTDRYTKAVDQLGHEKAIVRIGGIYALKRLALNSEIDRPMVLDVLHGYLRTSVPRPAGAGVPAPSTEVPRLKPDIQTALSVLVEVAHV
jgi:hypothetical protein